VLKRAIVALCAVFAVGLSATPALADAPFGPTAQVTDRVGALNTSQLTSVQAALASLYAKDRVKLFVTYVKDFSGTSPSTWVDQSATMAGMGQRDLLLGVATQARQYAVSTDTGFSLSTKQLDDVAATAIEPALRESDWAGAAIGAANGYAAALAGQPIPAPTITPGNANAGASSGSSAGAILGVIVVIALIGLIGFFFLRRRNAGGGGGRAAAGPPGPPALTMKELEAKAGHLLITTDDAIRTSEQELGFAAAQFGDDAIEPFTKAMESAKSELAAAFKLRQLLDDDIPEDEPTTRRMLEELCAHCEKANKLLDEQASAFDKLRDLEANAPQIIEQIAASAQQQPARLAAAQASLAQMTAQYAPSATADVAQNVNEAASRLEFQQNALTQAREAVASGDNSRAAVLAQAAQLADDQATQLIEGIDRRAGELTQASAQLNAALSAVDANVAEAAASGRPELRDPAVQAQMVATQVRTAMAGGPADPLQALRALEDSSTSLDQALAGAREEQVRKERARAALEQQVLTARSSIAAAADFINTNRGGVGSTARTRVAEAQRHLERALAMAATDPERALAEATQADDMATAAFREAQQDVSGFAGAGGMFGGGGGGNSGMAGMAGAMLGGILINSILGGAGGGGSRGAGSGRAAPPSLGSFGGASTRGRHSVGGKF
jgi:LPXTG-motif cell wall-anchored protein